MSGQPWMKFYPTDWRADPALRMCGLAARGLWIEMIAIMHEAEPRGHLLVNGRTVSSEQLAALSGSAPDVVSILLEELEHAGVFSRKKNGVIYSRRMEKDENKSRKNRENGKMGGNPSLCKDTIIQGSLIPEDNTQNPEARSQTNKEEDKSSSKKRATRLPEDFEPDMDFAVQNGLSREQAITERSKFKDYWIAQPGQKGVKVDWPATWRNWCRNFKGSSQRSNAPPQQPMMADLTGHLMRQMRENRINENEPDSFAGPTIESSSSGRDNRSTASTVLIPTAKGW